MSLRKLRLPVFFILLVASTLVCTGVVQAAVPRGLVVPQLLSLTAEERDAALDELTNGLRSAWLRYDVRWDRAEPAKGTYDEAYLRSIVDAAAAASARGLRVMITVYGTPRWASDSRLWKRPPAGLAPGYHPRYAPRTGSLIAFQEFMRSLASRCSGTVRAFECWNEPNLWMFLCPQKYGSDAKFGVRRYRDILTAFWSGVKESGSRALVVGGAIGPYGTNDWTRTSPNLFVRNLRYLGAGEYMDALSHHPYQIGSSHTFAPERSPRFPTRSITLSNLSVLTKLFPDKPIYLTEYGYNTKACPGIGGLGVGNARQAAYLKRAYAYAARYRQVKGLFWYLLQDEAPADGWTTGLRSAGDAPKASWYAFSRARKLTLLPYRSAVRAGRLVTLTGRLTWYSRGEARVGLANRVLTVRALIGGKWKAIGSVKTSESGAFAVRVRATWGVDYRLQWTGVVQSPFRSLRVY